MDKMENTETRCFIEWCRVNVSKAKEIFVDFRRKWTRIYPVTIVGQSEKLVDTNKYLDILVGQQLN